MADEYHYIHTPAGEYALPVGDPDATTERAVRLGTANGNSHAYRLEVNPPDDADHAVRIGLPNGQVGALSRVTATMLADFENGAWPDTWTNETGFYELTTTALEGQYSLRADGGNSQQVANPTISTPRGYTYSMRTVPEGSDGGAWLLTNVQDEQSALDNCYVARLEPGANELSVYKRVNGGTTTLQTVSVTASPGTEYIVALDVASDSVQARAFDASGSEMAATGYVSDTTHSGGYIGIYNSGDAAGGSRYDAFKQHSLGGV